MTLIVTDEFIDFELVRSAGCRIVRKGHPDLLRDYFKSYDDDPDTEAVYVLLEAEVSAEHLVNAQYMNRALNHFVRSKGGLVFIPRRHWDELHGSVLVSVDSRGASILTR